MSLDMTGHARYERDPHYRRYLDSLGRVSVICVQDFDYLNYDASRFLDTRAFASVEEASQAPIDLTETVLAASDGEGAAQALRNIRAVMAMERTWQ